MNYFISVIIICYNEESYIDKCLNSLVNQNYNKSDYEMILIDNGSTDKSVQIAKKFIKTIHIKPKLGLGEMRNYGAEQAKGEVLVFLDGDSEPDQDWLKNINALYSQNPNIITGAQCLQSEEAGWIPKSWFFLNTTEREKVPELCANNFFISKKIFTNSGGFDTHLTSGEDAELFARLRKDFEIYQDSKLKVVHHRDPNDLKTFFKREIWHGLGALGSFKIKKFDKPLIATTCYLFSIIILLISLVLSLAYSYNVLALMSFLSLNLIVLATLVYRKKYILNIEHATKLFILYHVYFLARSIALIILLFKFKHKYYKDNKN